MLSASEDGSYRVWRASDPINDIENEGFGCLENADVLGNDLTAKKLVIYIDEKPLKVSEQTKHSNSQTKTVNEIPQQTKGTFLTKLISCWSLLTIIVF